MKKTILSLLCLMPMLTNCANNQKIEITLETNPSTGYSWQYSCNPESGATVEENTELSKANSDKNSMIVGAPNQVTYKITKKSKKPVTCTFEYSRSWEKDTAPIQQFSVKL